MELLLSPVPHLYLPGDPGRQLIANAVAYGMALSLLGCLLWLAWLCWTVRER